MIFDDLCNLFFKCNFSDTLTQPSVETFKILNNLPNQFIILFHCDTFIAFIDLRDIFLGFYPVGLPGQIDQLVLVDELVYPAG